MDFSCLPFKTDRYNGVTILDQNLPKDPIAFGSQLRSSLLQWSTERRRGVWLKIPTDLSQLIPVSIDQGFRFHHCKRDYLMLVKWLPTDEKDNLPEYATHFIGVGGVVIREDTQEILVVQEKVSVIKDFWKIPGGHVDFNEFLPQAASREVFEETGIETEFVSLMTFRETLDYSFGLPDIYFVCLLRPLTFELRKAAQEIKEVAWMKIEDFVKLYHLSQFHSKIGEILTAALEARSQKQDTSSVLWKSENLQFKYGDYLRDQVIYYSDAVPKKKDESKL